MIASDQTLSSGLEGKLDRRLTTILAADVVGYSRLISADEEGVISRLRIVWTEVVDPLVASGGGRIVKTMGDGVLIEFSSPVEAVRCAVTFQREMLSGQADLSEDRRLRFRVGINLGDIVIDGDDILGDGVNVAARLESLATADGICISRAVHEQVKGKIDAPLTSIGPQYVKNLPEPVDAWRVEIDGAAEPAPKMVSAERPSIAVLPFDNMSADPDQEFLADGIVEDVITELSRYRSLFVIARGSTFAYKGTQKDVREIAEELGVRYVVEGSVRRADDRLRVTAQLIEADSGTHIWAERWDRTMTDLFDLQDEMTRMIVFNVEPELGANERAIARRKPTQNLGAWELCQKGYAEFVTYGEQGYKSSFDLYHAASRADPEFALPQALLARWYWNKIVGGRSTDLASDIRSGLEHAQNSIRIDDRLETGYNSLGILLAVAGREREAREALDKAFALNANDSLFYQRRANVSLFSTAPDPVAMEEDARTALALNPKDPLAWACHLMIAIARQIGRVDWTDDVTTEALETACSYPNADWYAFAFAAVCNVGLGRLDEARRRLAEATERRPDLSLTVFRNAFHVPIWPKLMADMEPELEKLVECGLPRG